jgi:hypothetical protein
VRVPRLHRPGRRMQELRGYGTTAQLLEMVAWLRHWGLHALDAGASCSDCWPVEALHPVSRSRAQPLQSRASRRLARGG